MLEKFPFRDLFGFQIIKKKAPETPTDFLGLEGLWGVEHWRSGELIDTFPFHNGISNQGKNYLLNCGFVSGTQILTANWCMSLIDNAGFIALSSGDTMSTKQWQEFTGYTQTSRPKWNPATSTAQLLTNPTLCQFDIGVSGIVYGGFIVSDSVIGGTGGTLWSSGSFPSPTNVTSATDQLRLVYNLAS